MADLGAIMADLGAIKELVKWQIAVQVCILILGILTSVHLYLLLKVAKHFNAAFEDTKLQNLDDEKETESNGGYKSRSWTRLQNLDDDEETESNGGYKSRSWTRLQNE